MRFKILNTKDRQGVIEYIENLNPEKEYTVDIALKRRIRTVSQNRLYWLYLTCIEDETGTDKDSLHDHFKNKFLRVSEITLGNDTITKILSTTKLTTKQFSEYNKKISVWANVELGIILPDPNDRMWEQFLDHYKDRL